MQILTRDELEALGQRLGGPGASIYMPTHRVGRGMQQDPIRLRNLLAEAEGRLLAAGLRRPEAKALLEPGQRLLSDSRFWQHQSDGLALFLSSEVARHCCLPLDLEELVVVGDRFHLKPLLPLLSRNGQFFVLAISLNGVRLFQATRFHVRELELEGAPASLAEVLESRDPGKRLQFRTDPAPPERGEGAALFHGHGAGADEAKADILRYFHRLDKGVHALLRGEQAPLVVAGVGYLHPIYREANGYPHLLEEGIHGNPDELRPEELRERAWAIIEPRLLEARREAAGRYRQAASAGQGGGDLEVVLPAACRGRVETLFVALGRQLWGIYDPDTGAVRRCEEAEPAAEDLLDLAAVQTLLRGGTVYAVPAGEVPGGTLLGAVLRY